ncbi:MAG: hypothetical protein KAH25_07560 [Bacteroidales bacterium]|nr:hypothetical protein [Bacteroidales bacterium]
MKKWIFIILGLISVLLLIVIFIVYQNIKDPHPGYHLNIDRPAKEVEIFKAGFAALPITPQIIDTWNDANEDAKYREDDGDTYNDNNNNGKFDAYWIAGFSTERAANGIHDDVWVRVAIFDDGHSRIAIVSLDAIGFMHDDVIDIRKQIPESAGLDYILIASTHTHESNDLIGIWGQPPFKSGVDPMAMEYVKSQTKKAILEAVKNLRPAKLAYAQDLTNAKTLVKDTREPQVKDAGIRIIQAIDLETNTTLGTLVSWANHPESLWSKNLLISSDFPHYIREGIEKGLYHNDSLQKQGLGGIAVYINGAVGGLMAPHPSISIKNPFSEEIYATPSFEKTKAIGEQIALLSLQALEETKTIVKKPAISIKAKTIYLPLENNTFALASSIGLLEKGMTKWRETRSEVAVFNIGPASFLSIPGEIYPEIVNGGVTAVEGRDFEIPILETPHLRALMPREYKFIIGLSNDEIGYIIPKSEWDAEPPYMFDPTGPYGEGNSFGPETGPIIYHELKKLLKK